MIRKKIFCVVFCLLSIGFQNESDAVVRVEDLTYEKLMNQNYTDHLDDLQRLFSNVHIHSTLEFGLGYGTKYLLDHSDHVTSVELLVENQNEHWLNEMQRLLSNYENWTPILKHASHQFSAANILAYRRMLNPSLYDATYLLEMKNLCDELFEEQQYEVAFVDPGFHMRGDLVNELFDRVPIIIAHDTNYGHIEYGWLRIQTPYNYEKIEFKRKKGVTFWVRKDRTDVISALKGTLYEPKEARKLRVFLPQAHPTLVKSFALALNYLGHTLVLPGESFAPHSPNEGIKLWSVTYFKTDPTESLDFTSFFSRSSSKPYDFLLQNCEVIENHEVLLHPPDVLVIPCPDAEKGMMSIYNNLDKDAQSRVKIVHHSGNNIMPFNKKLVRNLISTDAYTREGYDPFRVNICTWLPWIDYNAVPFINVNHGNVLNNFLNHYWHVFRNSFNVFQSVTSICNQYFPEISIESHKYLPQDELFEVMRNGVATLHIKESEGFGYGIIESMSCGRPVFLKRSFCLGSRLMNWAIEGKTAFFFDTDEEFVEKMKIYTSNADFRENMQIECASNIRRLIDNEKQARILEHFLQNLK